MADTPEGNQSVEEQGTRTDCPACQIPLEITSTGARCLNCGTYYYGADVLDFAEQASEVTGRDYKSLLDTLKLIRQPLSQAYKLLESLLPERRITLDEDISVADKGMIRYALSLIVAKTGMKYELLEIFIGVNPRMDYNEFPLEFHIGPTTTAVPCSDVHDFEIFVLENLKRMVPMVHLFIGFV